MLFFVIILTFLALTVFLFSLFFSSSKRQAKEVVEQFYTYEQQGLYSESWELFHPYMQEKFSKGHYLEDRPHVFMNHFGVSTFSYSIGDIKKVENWMMEDGQEPMDIAYKISVYQGFLGKYGKFTISQNVFVTEYEDNWRILWDYSS
ncbi:hypothetical protein D8M06_05205 [Oceanobacillus halophilus]|uniref:DUF4878 domain-containing protein n=2 Tax=Oceanobacillus halophilus TaxID=930130 RepID=A0A495A7X3_9BACI|nr:hypothetical protein D8M06_05205 [Oceanobacillus halophilus]